MDRLEPPRIGKADHPIEEGGRASFRRFSLRRMIWIEATPSPADE